MFVNVLHDAFPSCTDNDFNAIARYILGTHSMADAAMCVCVRSRKNQQQPNKNHIHTWKIDGHSLKYNTLMVWEHNRIAKLKYISCFLCSAPKSQFYAMPTIQLRSETAIAATAHCSQQESSKRCLIN